MIMKICKKEMERVQTNKEHMFGHSGKRKSYEDIWDIDREEGLQMKPEIVDKGEVSGGGENWKQSRTACGKAEEILKACM